MRANPAIANRRALTIVELIVVIGIISVLLGILLVALTGVRGQGRKLTEKNNIRQVGNGWLKYSQLQRGRIMPGWLSPRTQKNWETEIVYPDGTLISPAPTYSNAVPNIAGPWTWRLLPYLDNDLRILNGYREMEPLNHWESIDPDRREQLATEPAFGMNAYFLGGCWDRWYQGLSRTHPRFSRAVDEDGRRKALCATTLSALRRPSTVVGFVTTAEGSPGQTVDREDSDPGSWLATPHRLGEALQWDLDGTGDVDFLEGVSAPIGRYGGLPVTWHPDGHVESLSLEKLLDQRRWIDQAEAVGDTPAAAYRYTEGY